MSGDVHAGFCESRGVRFPPATHRVCRSLVGQCAPRRSRTGYRRAATGLWGVGAGLAATTGVLAVAHGKVGYGFVYAAVAAALSFLAAATRRGNRGAEMVTLVLLGSQLIGAAGAAWELAYGADDTAKARHLHDLGINHRLALIGNLAFSTLASAVFVWAVVRLVRGRRHRGP